MYKGIIFDLDETLVDTKTLKQFRDIRDWRACYSNFNLTILYDSTEKLIDACKNKGYKIGIVTMSPRPYAEKLLRHHDISYDVLIAYRDVVNKKPHPEPMMKCLEKLELDKSEIITIGDDVRDILSAKKAGIEAVGVSWGVSDKQSLLSVGALQVFDDNEELLNFLNLK